MAAATQLKIGLYSALTNAFLAHPNSPTGAVFDLNDGATFSLVDKGGVGDGFDWGEPKPEVLKSSNSRVMGERVSSINYRTNRTMKAHLMLGQSVTYTNFILALRQLGQLCNGITVTQPATLLFQASPASNPVYATILEAHLLDKYEELEWMQLLDDTIEVEFECEPLFFGPLQTLSNLANNPGFEYPSGPSVLVFNDPLTNFNAYTTVAGSAPTQDNLYFADVATSFANLLRYHRCDEPSGTVAYDASTNANAGTISATGVTYGVAGSLTGDTDTAMTFAAASTGRILVNTTSLPTGNPNLTFVCAVKIAAHPGANQSIFGFGLNTIALHNQLQVYIDSSGRVNTDTGGGTAVQSTALSLNTWHLVGVTWDGTTQRLYIDGSAVGTPQTPGALNITSVQACNFGCNAAGSLFLSASVDEMLLYNAALSATSMTALYNAWSIAPAVTSNTMLIPTNGWQSFGSPNWLGINEWQLRFRYTSGMTAILYASYQNSSNYLECSISQAAISVVNNVAGTVTTPGTSAMHLVPGVYYWLRFTNFPAANGGSGGVSAQLYGDNAGAVGSGVANIVYVGLSSNFAGTLQMHATGAALGVGGNFAGVNAVYLFGPGGWLFTSTGTGQASGAWDTSAGTPTGVPVTSFGAARVDIPPVGTLNATWNLYNGGATSTVPAIAATASTAYSFAAYVKSWGLSVTASLLMFITEYDGSGNSLRNGTVQTLTGNQASWTQLAGQYTTGAGCVYLDIALQVTDTAASAGGTVWWNNVQAWNVTATGQATMPYCEMRFPQSPATVVLSGVLGDLAAPCAFAFGTYFASWANGSTLNWYFGRRSQPNVNLQAMTQIAALTTSTPTAVLDPTSWGGFYAKSATTTGTPQIYNALPVQTADVLKGAYHLLYRTLCTQTTGNIGNVTGGTNQWEGPAGPTPVYTYFLGYGPSMPILSAGNTWTVVDGGQINIPYVNSGALRDLTQVSTSSIVFLHDTTGGGSAFQVNWTAILPVDGDILLGLLNNPSNAVSVPTSWVWAYADGLNPLGAAWLRSVETYSTPNELTAVGGIGTQTTGYISINPTGDAYLMVDPNQRINTLGTNLNQIVGILTDNSGDVLPLYTEIRYFPLYLYPR